MADNYEVTNQRTTTRLTPAGTFEDVVEITFRTKPSGAYGSVMVPTSSYLPDKVKDVLSASAAAMEDVHQS